METVKLIVELYFGVFFEVIILGLLPLLGQDSGEQTGKHWAEKGGDQQRTVEMGIKMHFHERTCC